MYLLIDDAKTYSSDITARTAKAGKLVLERLFGHITELGIDFDLGGKISGYDIVKWALANGYLPKRIQVVSMNPVGRQTIVNVLLDNGYRSKDNTNFVRGD